MYFLLIINYIKVIIKVCGIKCMQSWLGGVSRMSFLYLITMNRYHICRINSWSGLCVVFFFVTKYVKIELS